MGWGWGGGGAEAGPHYADCVSRLDLGVCVYLYNLSISAKLVRLPLFSKHRANPSKGS